MFTDGIKLNENIFHQERVKLGYSKNNKISFCPNSFVTSWIFSKLKLQNIKNHK